MKQEYPDWDELSASQKKIARDNLLNKRRFDIVHSAVLETKKHDEWAGKVDAFLEDDAQIANYTGLAGREQEFKNFCMKPTRVGVDLGDLVSAFLYTVPAPSGRHKGSLLQTGSNATGVDTKPKKMNEEDAEALRAKNPKAYLDAIKSGKIDIDI